MAREEITSSQPSHEPSPGILAAPYRGQREVHSDDVKIEQRPVVDPDNYDGDIIIAQKVVDLEYAQELAFNEEPVTIRLEPSSDKNAIAAFPVWVNGQGAEIFQSGRWMAIGWLPVGKTITVRRKVLEVIARTKVDTVHTEIRNPESEHPDNKIQRYTSAVHSYSIIEDRNPRGVAWMQEIRRRNM